MSPELLRTIARWHALVAWVATAALIATAAAQPWERARRARVWIGAAAALLAVAAGGLGMALHDAWRARLRQKLFLTSAALGWWFERKQHFAFAAVLLAVSGAALAIVTRRAEARPGGDAMARELRRGAVMAWTAAALLALAASIASAAVARRVCF